MSGFICKRFSACAEHCKRLSACAEHCKSFPAEPSLAPGTAKWTNSWAEWTLSPLNGLREMAFLKQTRAGSRQEQSRVLGSELLFCPVWRGLGVHHHQFQILFRKHIF